MIGFRGWGALLVLLGCGRVFAENAVESPPPEAEQIVEGFEAKLVQIDQTFAKEAERLRSEYRQAMTILNEKAIRQGDVDVQLWADRCQRHARDSESAWLAMLIESYDFPEPLADLNAEAHAAAERLRENGLAALAESKGSALKALDDLVKHNVRANLIDQALLTRDTKILINTSAAYPKIESRFKRFHPERAAGDLRKRVQKPLKESRAPPDAAFPFRADNPAFAQLLKSVVIESSGHRDGPFARIALGRVVDYTGSRGLAVVAVKGSEVLLKDTYDTYAFEAESVRLIEDLKSLPYGTFLMLAVRDDATRRFSGRAQSSLSRFGAGVGILDLPYRSSYLMIGLKGLPPGEAVEKHSPGTIRFGGEEE